ncbi:MAG: peptide deformylase [Rhodospirillaceae bacterium]|nr:peptide deformylase [Rhodospirillaceae bacterium]
MAQLEIIVAPDPRLKVKSKSVKNVDDDVRALMDDLLDTMYAASNGVGLAAPQIGVAKRVLVIDMARGEEAPQPLCIANPEIIWTSDETIVNEEGCLSVPEYYAEVKRSAAVKVRYLDYENEIREMEADDFLAICIQHEIDHLDGILFVDHLSALKRNIVLRKMAKVKKQLTESEAKVPTL